MLTDTDRAALRRHLGWVCDGTALLAARLDTAARRGLGAPSKLPGWTRAHVLGHLARNADALGNLVYWARTGEPTPMYPDPERREADIDAAATLPAGELLADVRTTAERLGAAMADLAEPAWDARVRSAKGRCIPARDVPWLRVREVWVHLVDLEVGFDFADFPASLVDALLTDAAGTVGGKPDCPPVRLSPTGTDRAWSLGTGEPTVVSGAAPDLLGWLLGRTTTGISADGAPPGLPAWL